jgi:hypothetical protein
VTPRRLASALAALLVAAAPLRAQDSLIVLDPSAPAGDSVLATGLPAAVFAEALARFNDSATARFAGDVRLPPGSRLTSALGAHRGTTRIHGTVEGPVTVINGDLVLGAGAVILGDVLVVGGRLSVAPGARVEGEAREFAAEAPVVRRTNGMLAERDPQRSLADLASAEATFERGRFRSTIRLATAGTYNRLEGLPVIFGPRADWQFQSGALLRLELLGILRTAGGDADLLSDLGVTGRAELRLGRPNRLRLQLEGYSRVEPISDLGLSASESGWYALLAQRDYRDYFDANGGALTASWALAPQFRLEGGVRLERERTILANDPFSLFRDEGWRPNPLIDDGEYLTWRLGAEVDTRPSPSQPSRGMYARVGLEYTGGEDVAPVDLPATVRSPIPTDGSYEYARASFDFRGYRRLGGRRLLAARVLGEGWVGGDPLPLQRRLALGGPGLLDGYDFRAFDCSDESGHHDPARPALCDRLLMVQAEFRQRFRLGLTRRIADAERSDVERVVGIEEADFVVFADAGTAWLAGDGPGRVPSDKLPSVRDWHADVGVGLSMGGLGVYLAKAIEEGEPVRLVLRLRRRF